jgi:electron transport complex protein RnfG
MTMNWREIPRQPAGLLGGMALAGLGFLALVQWGTHARIEQNRRDRLRQDLEELVPAGRFDNDPVADRIAVADPRLGTPLPVAVYRARQDGRPVAAILAPVAPDGYGGPIRLLAAVGPDGRLLGVRVLEHRETPGLGDGIEADKSPWIEGFAGRFLDDPPAPRWAVKRDGGDFDQLAGATVTPRAVVQAVRRTLDVAAAHRDRLFTAPAGSLVED